MRIYPIKKTSSYKKTYKNVTMKTGLHLKNKAGGGCMFQIGDEISYTNKGIFQVKEIINKRNRKREVESWYVLHSINNDVETSITTPVTNPNLRLMMSKEDILQLIEDMPTLETVWSDDRHVREDRFEKMLNSGDIRQWATMSKTIYEMKKQKEINKKNISERDKFFFDRGENLLFDEISLCLHIKRDDVHDFIYSKHPVS